MKKLLNEEGLCPFCGECDLEYGCIEPADTMMYYPWTCKNCGKQGEEWYDMRFAGHSIENEDGCMEEVDEVNKKGGI